MKRFNCDAEMLDEFYIEQAIRNVCVNKKKNKKRSTRKYQKAQTILNNIEIYTKRIKTMLEYNNQKYLLESQNKEIPRIIEEKMFKPSKCKSFVINDGTNKKTRTITSVPIFPDQCIHELIIMMFKKTLLGKMYDHSYASIPGRGLHKCAKHVKKIIQHSQNCSDIKYICKIDIKKCYPSTSHSIIKKEIDRKYKGYLMKKVIFDIIDSYHESKDENNNNKVGIAIGYSISQWIANLILTRVDIFIKHNLKIKNYVRYMDDMVMFGSNKRKIHKQLKLLRIFLKGLKYKIKKNWQIFKFDYINKKNKRIGRMIDFVGFKFYRDKTTLRRGLFLKLKRQAKKIFKYKLYYLSLCRSFISRIGWLKHCNSKKIYTKYIENYVDVRKIKGVISYEDRNNAIC